MDATAPQDHRFTSANAREMAKLSWLARKRREAEPATAPLEAEYVAEQLAITRAHLERLDKRLATASDALDIDRLARARASLAEQERILAGRPLPGKAQAPKPGKTKAPDLMPG